MSTYPKITTVWKRDPDNNYKTLIEGEWAKPEFGYLADCQWIATEKIDGTNIRVIWDGESVSFRGRTDRAQIPPRLHEALVDLFPVERCREAFTGPITLYGEGYGPKIQKGGHRYREDPSFVLFDALAGGVWLDQIDRSIVARSIGVDQVPQIFQGTLRYAIRFIQRGAEPSRIATDQDYWMEGLVLRPLWGLRDRHGERIITKIKVKDFPWPKDAIQTGGSG